jgi:hypothetical protein
MSLLTLTSRVRRPVRRPGGQSPCEFTPAQGPLPLPLRRVVELSADLVAALMEVEQRDRATLDDLEWADAVAARIVRREDDRVRRQSSCASTATTPRRKPSTARRAAERSGPSATSAT